MPTTLFQSGRRRATPFLTSAYSGCRDPLTIPAKIDADLEPPTPRPTRFKRSSQSVEERRQLREQERFQLAIRLVQGRDMVAGSVATGEPADSLDQVIKQLNRFNCIREHPGRLRKVRGSVELRCANETRLSHNPDRRTAMQVTI